MESPTLIAIAAAVATTLVLAGLVWFLKRRLRLVDRLSFPLTIAALVGGIKVFTLFDVGDLQGFDRLLSWTLLFLTSILVLRRYGAWWRAAQIYDRRLDKKSEAVEAYRQIAESSTHYADAQRRIGRLSR